MLNSPVLRDDGIPVPFMPFKDSGVISGGWIPFEEYRDIPEVFCQRNTDARLSRARKHLAALLPEHTIVFTARLTKDDSIFGKKYKAGQRWRLDSNTRAKNWEDGGSDFIPDNVFNIEFAFDSCERIQKSYNTFDSADSVERNQEKVYGIFVGNYRWTPTSTKLLKGQILTALHKACQYFDNDNYPFQQSSAKPIEVVGQIGTFLPELKHLDKFMQDPKSWDQHLICAALLAIKKHGENNDRLNTALQYIDRKAADTRDLKKCFDGVTHIVVEWDRNEIFVNKNTKFKGQDNLDCTLPWLLYCIEKFLADKKQQRINRPVDYAHNYVTVGDLTLNEQGDLSQLFA